ncbi:MAG TPA: protein translocase subunit SecD [Gammaproteobacteria bacterium]|nr:protein translocase subunit SecD [Gammaproteobacteria bacterium]
MNQYPAWKYILLIAIVAAGLLFALPNIYGEDPAVQVAMANSAATLPTDTAASVRKALTSHDLHFKSVNREGDHILARFDNTETQLKAEAAVKAALGDNYSVAVNLAPRTPEWLRAMGLQPMNRGLDLQGGVHFLLQVDIQAAVEQALTNYRADIQDWLREKLGPAQASVQRVGSQINIRFHDEATRDRGESIINDRLRNDVAMDHTLIKGDPALVVRIPESKIAALKTGAVDQNIAALRNRLNDLGVAEPLIQRQGRNQIVVELPGVQDIAQAKDRLHAKATIQFRLVDMTDNAQLAARTGHVPLNAQLYTKTPRGAPLLLKRGVIASGKGLAGASPAPNPQGAGWVVNVNLNSEAASRMLDATRKNVGKNMAVVLIQDKTTLKKVNGKTVREHHKVESVINNATIQGVFSNRFQIEGLSQAEATQLATQLKFALAVPMDIVGQRVVGPSQGAKNIERGMQSLVIGFIAVVVFMALYYKAFGLMADAALLMNVVLIVALLSILQATLTLPGIAGIVLTVGMAVDANVLIYEHIREELRNGATPQAAIFAGYERAFLVIADANITTLIAGVVLFMFGSGPVKGFAVTLSLGILTSMFTAIVGTRAIVNLTYGRRKRVKKLLV